MGPGVTVIGCDKREAFAQGSEATKQSNLSLPIAMDCFADARNDGSLWSVATPRHAEKNP
jgi:hypothetical protein